MRDRLSLILGASIVLGCLILGLFFGRPTEAQVPPRGEGRYQVLSVGRDTPAIVVFEPATAQCWTYDIRNVPRWVDLGSPVVKKQAIPKDEGQSGARQTAEAIAGKAEKLVGRLVINVDAAGKVTVGGEELAGKDLKAGLAAIREKTVNDGAEIVLVEIRAAAGTPSAKVTELMAQLRSAGFTKVRLQVAARNE